MIPTTLISFTVFFLLSTFIYLPVLYFFFLFFCLWSFLVCWFVGYYIVEFLNPNTVFCFFVLGLFPTSTVIV
ncbi:hypothetical protein L873DRAFT_1434786 [Choiromyces venosus 120613-1]|uniref:Uncharacterized protein n=1 Tax=Choiromyces venosus 120613-1 TaxID=1336337 RepID=A0A3N4J825_9PEZI|nr:hypothetical protein L873DRAFT_1434786 [Choiromyces venosus 120613-1]